MRHGTEGFGLLSVRSCADMRWFSHLASLVWLVHQRYGLANVLCGFTGLIDMVGFELIGCVTGLCICLGLLGYTLVWMLYVWFISSVYLLLFCFFSLSFMICVCQVLGNWFDWVGIGWVLSFLYVGC